MSICTRCCAANISEVTAWPSLLSGRAISYVGIFGGPLAALLYQYTHGWHVVFSCAIGLDFITAALYALLRSEYQ
jgi:hypothetical protein